MSVKNALGFIARLRADETLKEQLVSLAAGPELEDFVTLGDEIGLSFTVDELRIAHKYEWGMRYIAEYDDT